MARSTSTSVQYLNLSHAEEILVRYLAINSKTIGGAVLAVAFLMTGLIAGCKQEDKGHDTQAAKDNPPDSAARVKAARAKLPAEDLKLVESQEFCPVLTRQRLGAKGQSVQATLEDQRIFLCCDDCSKNAKIDP